MNTTAAATDRNVSCMVCGDRFATVAESVGHACFTPGEAAPAVDDFVIVGTPGITGVYTVDRRGDWHLIARSDVPQ